MIRGGTLVSLSFDELRQKNVERCEAVFHKLTDWQAEDWTVALAGEVGEALNEVKKLYRLQNADKAQDSPARRYELLGAIGAELADVVTYLDLLAASRGLQTVQREYSDFADLRYGTQIALAMTYPISIYALVVAKSAGKIAGLIADEYCDIETNGPNLEVKTGSDLVKLVKSECRIQRQVFNLVNACDALACKLGLDLGGSIVAKFNVVSARRGSNVLLSV